MRTFQEHIALSVIIPTLNEAASLPRTLAALRPAAMLREIVVADGRSSDETIAIAGAAGARANGTIWMHNTTARQASAIPHLTDLASHDGRVVSASAGRFQPATLTIAPNASASATVEVVLGDVAPGVYRGHILARGLPDVALPVRLLVRTEAGPP